MSEDKAKWTIWLWTGLGAFAGFWLGGIIGGATGIGWLGAIILCPVIGFLAYRRSKKNNGGPPSWLWRSKKK